MWNNSRREAVNDDTAHDARVASLLEAAASPSEPGPLPGEAEALAAFVRSRSTSRRSPVLTARSAKTAMAVALSGVLLTGGIGAAAASGSLPGAAQDTASEWLAKVGVSVPGAHGRADRSGRGEDAVAGDDTGEDVADDSASDKGEAVSGMARDGEVSGRDKGAAVSELASEGRSRAGEHGDHESSESEQSHDSDAADRSADFEERSSEGSREHATSRRYTRTPSPDTDDKADTTDDVDAGEAEDSESTHTEENDGSGDGSSLAGSGERP